MDRSGDPMKGPPADRRGSISFSRPLGDHCVHMGIELEGLSSKAIPGQFFLIRERGVLDPLLGRPLALVASEGNVLEFLFRVSGRGTARLATLPPGAALELRGPCGNGFPEPVRNELVLVAGTLGIAPFIGIPSFCSERVRITAVLGVPGKGWEPFVEWCSERFTGIRINSDDGSIGRHGDPVEDTLLIVGQRHEVWGCGPEAMLRGLGRVHEKGCDRLLVSLEKRMACGTGGCLGCSIRTGSGSKRVCVDGPVFEWRQVFGGSHEI